jgi:putative Mn2+ efflux pump MntP
VSLSLGLSNFAAAIGIGLSGIGTATRLRTALAFGLFEALMPVLGLLLGRTLGEQLDQAGRYVGAVLLVLTGSYVRWEARRAKADSDQTEAESNLSFGHLLVVGFALSLDNFVVGFALSFTDVSLLVAPVVIAVTSVAMSLVGLELGDRLGTRFEQWSAEVGGVVLILVGLAMGSGRLA